MFEIKQTTQHLSKLLKENKSIDSIKITAESVQIYYNTGISNLIGANSEPSLIDKILDNVGVNPDLCIECMTDDNMRNSEFFQYQMKAYIHFLTLKYGPEVPISCEMAKYFLKHDLLTDHTIYSVGLGIPVTKEYFYDGGFLSEDKFILTYE